MPHGKEENTKLNSTKCFVHLSKAIASLFQKRSLDIQNTKTNFQIKTNISRQLMLITDSSNVFSENVCLCKFGFQQRKKIDIIIQVKRRTDQSR